MLGLTAASQQEADPEPHKAVTQSWAPLWGQLKVLGDAVNTRRRELRHQGPHDELCRVLEHHFPVFFWLFLFKMEILWAVTCFCFVLELG